MCVHTCVCIGMYVMYVCVYVRARVRACMLCVLCFALLCFALLCVRACVRAVHACVLCMRACCACVRVVHACVLCMHACCACMHGVRVCACVCITIDLDGILPAHIYACYTYFSSILCVGCIICTQPITIL